MILSVSSCGNNSSKTNLEKYISVTFTGINGQALAEKKIDLTQFEKDVAPLESININLDTMSFANLSKILAIESAIDYIISPNSELSNGDKVTLTCTVNQEDLNKVGAIGSYKEFSKEYTVTGLST